MKKQIFILTCLGIIGISMAISCTKSKIEIAESDPTPITTIFKSLDAFELQKAIHRNDTQKVKLIEASLANQIRQHYLKTDNIDLFSEFENNSQIALLGLMMALNEQHVFKNNFVKGSNGDKSFYDRLNKDSIQIARYGYYDINMPEIDPESTEAMDKFSCVWDELIDIFGATTIYALYSKFIAGTATITTAVGLLKFALGRVAWGLTVAVKVYNVGKCMGWWYMVPYNEDSVAAIAPIDLLGESHPRLPWEDSTILEGDSIIFNF